MAEQVRRCREAATRLQVLEHANEPEQRPEQPEQRRNLADGREHAQPGFQPRNLHQSHFINRFLDPQSGDTFQVDNALDSFAQGGWFGKGPGEGTVKRILPDSHTDFIFAVTAEEFGIIL